MLLMTIECKHSCEQVNDNRITIDRTLTPYDDGLKFCGICNVWYVTSDEVFAKVFGFKSTSAEKSYHKNLVDLIKEWFSHFPNKCPCCGTKLRLKPRRHTKRSEEAVRY